MITAGFLTKVTIKTLEEELQESGKIKHKHDALSSKKITQTMLDELRTAKKITTNTIQLIRGYGSFVLQSKMEVNAQLAENYMMKVIVWDWVEWSVELGWHETSYDPGETTNLGICKLLLQIQVSAAKSGLFHLDSSSYLLDSTEKRDPYILNFPCKIELRPSEIRRCATEILAFWLDLPDPIQGLPQSWFLKEIIKRIGISVLRLRAVMKATNRVSVSVLGMSKNAVVFQKYIHFWSENFLATHALCNPNSKERALFTTLSDRLSQLAPFDHALVNQVNDIAAHQLSSTLTTCLSLLPPVLPTHPPPSAISNAGEFERYWKCITLCLPFLKGVALSLPPLENLSRNPTNQEQQEHVYHIFLSDVSNNLDNLLPFRDLAPSRVRILQDRGPYSPEHIRTISGFFSALIFRGITFGSQFLFDHFTTVFENLDDWTATYRKLGSGHHSSFFCNPNAYRNRTNRDVNSVEDYWRFVSNPQNHQWLLEWTETINIYDLFKKLMAQRLPGLGVLGCIDVCLDYAQCGIATQPTAEEIISMLKSLRKTTGLVSCLRGFGLDDKDMSRGLADVQNALIMRWPDREDVLDMIFVYHSIQCWRFLDQKKYKFLFSSDN